MLTKKQYKFLKDFIKVAKKSKESDKQLKYFNREKVKVEAFAKLLSEHPELYPAEPFNNKENQGGRLEGTLLISFINDTYLDKIGLKECFEYFAPFTYGLSKIGIQKIDEYKREYSSRIRLPKIAIGISIFALLISIFSCIFGFIN